MLSSSACCTLLAAFILSAFVAVGNAQMVKQCLCSKIQPCSNKYMNTWKTCMRQCKGHLSGVGGNVDKLGHCLDNNQALLQSTIKCTQSHSQTAEKVPQIFPIFRCAKSPSAVKQVPKRYPETLEIATISEINRMINRMGIGGAMKDGCRQENVRLCGLSLPPDNVLVQQVKRCAINSGLNTANAKAMCKCAAAAGVKNLTPVVCARIRFT
ncbi:hypothetical protein niasHS_014193 [Heterodera schachtii]|uniref:Uncharacterized protein n=1 Tax=Heterodera schachtii TaxID=97005 RepID=A0ABD2IN76_HETSC